jgi:hypothetical protein
MLGQTIAPNPRNISNDSIIQGIDISQGNSNCISELTLSSATASNESIYWFCEYFVVCHIDSKGNVSIMD